MNELQVLENNGQRVMTTAVLAECYETSSRVISDNFNNNKGRYTEGKHYYCLTGNELRDFKSKSENFGFAPNLGKLYLWTEKGALLHAKSLNTDKAWEVYDYLVESYFKKKEELPTGNNLIALAVIEAQKMLEQKDKELQIKNAQIEEIKPKASYYDVVLNCKDLLSTTAIAKDYGWSAKAMNKFLNEQGIQFKGKDGVWYLYEKYAKHGYTSSKTHAISGDDGKVHSHPHTYWTQKGRLFIYNFLKERGIKPLIENELDTTA
ncbi:MAG: phage antirepressor KilAC domain-containing protein [Clostridia bacterium]|nr:phage antirepressor KilAC domain-containing protein [Clostridia bacterium]